MESAGARILGLVAMELGQRDIHALQNSQEVASGQLESWCLRVCSQNSRFLAGVALGSWVRSEGPIRGGEAGLLAKLLSP